MATGGATVYLKAGYTLKGKDVLPVVQRLRAIKEGDEPTELASLRRKYPLGSYTEAELKKEFIGLTGYQLPEVLGLVGMEENLQSCQWAMHAAILQANATGEPAGQALAEQADKDRPQPEKTKKQVGILLGFIVTGQWGSYIGS